MADAVASPVLTVVLDRLNSLFSVSGGQIWRKIQLTLAEIQPVAMDAEKLQERNKTIKLWLTDVRNVAYDADDLLDEAQLLFLLKSANKKVKFYFSCLKLERKLKKVEARLDEIMERCQLLGNFFSIEEVEQNRRTVSLIHESDIFGRENDKKYIIEWLLNKYDDRGPNVEGKVSVLSIVGMGGIGKTTLAKLVYNDERVVSYYDLRVWVYVSEEFNLTRVVKEILETATLQKHDDILNLNALGRRLNRVLRGRKFLLVLDDVWEENYKKWSKLFKSCLRNVHRGSKIIITTRNVNLADVFGGVLRFRNYFLRGLPYEDCWALFKNTVFGDGDGDGYRENINLEQMGMRIIEKCQGLPLALKLIGSLLRFKREESQWLSILNSNMWNLPVYGRSILPALRLTYDHFPPHLKLCFAFCSIFPKGYTINKEKLTQWWIASGFVFSTIGRCSMSEDIANDFFEELLESSFFKDVARDEFGNIVVCQMHDLIHDLALSVAGKDCSVVETGLQQNISKDLRHTSLIYNGSFTIPEGLCQARNLRTLLSLSGKFKNLSIVFEVFKCLRVLHLGQCGLRELPDSIGNLIHLRYLDLSRTYIKALPISIGKLKSLQILELFECFNLHKLPKPVSELTNLRHLGIQSCPLLSHMPFGIRKLRLLQTLPTFILGKTRSCGCLNDLIDLNLRGRLEIKNLERVKNLEEDHDAKLYEKPSLVSLRLSWGHEVDTRMSAALLEILRPPPGLKYLDIIGYRGSIFPSWLWNANFLVKLSLIDCSCQELPPLGRLPCLRDLSMKGLSEVETISQGFYGDHTVRVFPSLKQLEVFDLLNLLEWKNLKIKEKIHPTETAESSYHLSKIAFPCLETLSVKGCTKLTTLPLLPNLKKLALSNCNIMLLGYLTDLESLSSLVINEFRDPILSIKLEGSNSIKTLSIYNCDNLICLLEESMQGFTSLEHLSIICCDKLKSLPMGLRYLTCLQKLDIVECHELVKIADIFPHLPSLQEFTIEGCPSLDSLPDSIQSINTHPRVVVKRCPRLEKNLNWQKGNESSKTAHIPFIKNELGVEEDEKLSASLDPKVDSLLSSEQVCLQDDNQTL